MAIFSKPLSRAYNAYSAPIATLLEPVVDVVPLPVFDDIALSPRAILRLPQLQKRARVPIAIDLQAVPPE